MGRTYDNIYPTWPHDPRCGCCHPNDRPYCDCPCHARPTRAGAVAALARLAPPEVIPCAPPTGLTNRARVQLPPPTPAPSSRRYVALAREGRADD